MKQNVRTELSPSMLRHRLLALVFPTLFLTLIVRLLHDFIDLLPAPGLFFLLVLLVSGIASLMLQAISSKVRLAPSTNIRVLVWLLVLTWLAHALISPNSGIERFIPSLLLIITLVALSIQWTWTNSMASCFYEREKLLREVAHKKGHALYTVMRDEGYLVTSVEASLKNLSVSCGWATAGVTFLVFFGLFFNADTSMAAYILLVIFFVLALYIQVMKRFYVKELSQATLGLNNSFALTQARLEKAILLLVSGSFFASIISRSTALLPPTPFIWLYNAILCFMRSFSRSPKNHKRDIVIPDISLSTNPSFEQPGPTITGNSFTSPIWTYLKYILVVIAGFALLWFLFGFIFKEDFRTFFTNKNLQKMKDRFWAGLKGLFTFRFSRNKRKDFLLSSDTRKNAESSFSAQGGQHISGRKKREIGNMTKQFLKVLRWGETAGLKKEQHHGPAEYTENLSKLVPEKKAELARAAELFEKALYSGILLTRNETRLYHDSVRIIIAKD